MLSEGSKMGHNIVHVWRKFLKAVVISFLLAYLLSIPYPVLSSIPLRQSAMQNTFFLVIIHLQTRHGDHLTPAASPDYLG